jgi:hypothetical protein
MTELMCLCVCTRTCVYKLNQTENFGTDKGHGSWRQKTEARWNLGERLKAVEAELVQHSS